MCIRDRFVTIATKLENHYRDMQDMEFTIEDGKLYMLQTRNGKRTAAAALKIAVDLVLSLIHILYVLTAEASSVTA